MKILGWFIMFGFMIYLGVLVALAVYYDWEDKKND